MAGAGWGEGARDCVIRATDNHPWYVVGRGWVRTVDLRIGNRLRTADGSLALVTDKFDNGAIEPVFNLCVANAHTYFVGDEHCAVLVHNASVQKIQQILDRIESNPGQVSKADIKQLVDAGYHCLLARPCETFTSPKRQVG